MPTLLLSGCALLLFLVAVIAPAFIQRNAIYSEGPRIEQSAILRQDLDCGLWMVLKSSAESQRTQHIEIVWHDAQHDRGSEVRPG